MFRSRPLLIAALLVIVLASGAMTSCGGSGGSGLTELVLLSFNHPNIAGVALNAPCIFTFSTFIDPGSITPDTLRIVGAVGPFFETTVVDGNLLALLPRSPNRELYEDLGLGRNTRYDVNLAKFPAVATIRSVQGDPLVAADDYFFITSTAVLFVEPRRAIVHGPPPSAGGKSDDQGCLQNRSNLLYVAPNIDASVVQSGSGPGAKLLCLQNEGAPRVIEPESFPRHDQRAVGTPSAVNPGFIDMPAIRVRLNEPLDPASVAGYNPSTLIPLTIQLWRVALRDGTFIDPERIQTNKPSVVQTATDFEIILVPAAPVRQGIYLINILPQVKDLPGNALMTSDRPNPALGGYNIYEAEPIFAGKIPAGYRLYFHTLQVPNTALAIGESFSTNGAEHGDLSSAATEPGLYSESVADAGDTILDGNPMLDTAGGNPSPNATKTYAAVDPTGALIGQTTTANWNEATGSPGTGFRFLNLPSLVVNQDGHPAGGADLLRAVWKPYTGTGFDGDFTTSGLGAQVLINTDASSVDGILEVNNFTLAELDEIQVTGSKPLLILARGDVEIQGRIVSNGSAGGVGLDTDGTGAHSNVSSIAAGGVGGSGGAGGGSGGAGADPTEGDVSGGVGGFGQNLFGTWAAEQAVAALLPGRGGDGVEDLTGLNEGSAGGGGGGFGTAGASGTNAAGGLGGPGATSNAGSALGSPTFERLLTLFMPDRGYSPFSNIAGGTGGGGGSGDDDNGGSETGNGGVPADGDDGGGGGGGGGGAVCIIANGVISVRPTAVIELNGGAGGRTVGPADQVRDAGEDMSPGNADDVIVGVSGVAASGDGGPGGGGSGGGLLLIGRQNLLVNPGATLSAVGGPGGSSDNVNRIGGAGGDGRISLITFVGSPLPTNLGGGSPAPFVSTGAADQYAPTVDEASVGMCEWIDLVTPNADFAPDLDGLGPLPPELPTFSTNFAALTGMGLLQGPGGDFDARFEFQGAADLSPAPTAGVPTAADGLTNWVDYTAIDAVDGKRYIRWRWRFFVSESWNGLSGALADPLPQVFDLEIQFVRN